MANEETTKVRTDFTSQRHSTSYDYISPLELDLAGKYALVTGAAWETGVGFAVATAFVRAGVSGIAVLDRQDISTNIVTRLEEAASALRILQARGGQRRLCAGRHRAYSRVRRIAA